MDLSQLGWRPFFASAFEALQGQGYEPARVVRADRNRAIVMSEHGALDATIAGRLAHDAVSKADFPAVGDWVAISGPCEGGAAVIHAVLPRRSKFSRRATVAKRSSKTDEQVLVANVDTVLLIGALDGGRSTNQQQIERYLTLAWDSGADSVVVLNKADMCDDVPAVIRAVTPSAISVPIHVVSAMTGEGIRALTPYLSRGQTVALLGPSGVGKSTIINRLLGADRLAVSEVRESDRRGRHTTTCGEMVFLPEGAMLIDTPGLRTLHLRADEESLGEMFRDIEALAAQCRFNDCAHTRDPGCAILAAIDEGLLDVGRYRRYLILKEELHCEAMRQDRKQQLSERATRRAASERSAVRDRARRRRERARLRECEP
ncbi:MAG: ribosome small subunit-dependent GTPase A [Phycisphaerales bacterium]|nr:ribosome small subunit-dependent GTPase A [Phycisphaerales bacterium]